MRCNKRVVSLTLRGTEGSSTLVERIAELKPHNCQACREWEVVIKNGIPPSNSINISPFSHSSIRELESVEYGPKCD